MVSSSEETRISSVVKEYLETLNIVTNKDSSINHGFDSFALVDLLLFIENEFHIEILQEEISLSEFSNVKDIARFIIRKINTN